MGSDADDGAVNDDGTSLGSEEEADNDNAADEKDGAVKDDEAEERDLVEETDEILPTMAARAYGTLQNGDFETDENEDWKPDSWEASAELWVKNGENGKTGKYVGAYNESETDSLQISLSQKVDNIEPGTYTLSGEAGGQPAVYQSVSAIVKRVEKDNDGNYTDVDTLIQKTLNELGAAEEKWDCSVKFTTSEFEIAVPEGENQVNIEVLFSGSLGTGQTLQIDNIKLEKVTEITYADLQSLITEAEAEAAKTEVYTADSIAALQTAINEVKEQNLSADSSAEDIKAAYDKIQQAMDALKSSSTAADVTFYYYAGDTQDEVGLHIQGDNISTIATAATWTVNTSDAVNLFTAVDGYTGWYSVPVKISNGGADSGFTIYTSGDTSAAKVSYSASENADIYTNLADGTNESCAYKNGISYSGTDESTGVDKAAAVMRNVTFYAYSEEAIPALQLDNKSAASKLVSINEETGAITEISNSGTDAWNNPVWDLQKVSEEENWYSISFSVPGKIEADAAKICGWYMKDSTGNYEWTKDIKNGGETAGDNISIMPVFAGNVYYKDGTFYASMEEADAITLGRLNTLLASEELKKITDKGETGYTAETWAVFSTALQAAQKAAEDNQSEAESFTSDVITKAYNDLQTAMKALVSLSADVTLYCYVGETEDEVGLYYWDKDTSKGNLTSTADKAEDWYVWGEGDTYLMAAVDGYAGWYSIPLSFVNGGADAGFQIFTKTAALATEKKPLYQCDEATENHSDVYDKLTSGDNDTFAIKKNIGYEGAEKTAQIMRNVTLYAYGKDVIPALQLDNNCTAKKLTVVDEETGLISDIDVSGKDSWDNPVWDLQKMDGARNWYVIEFSAPGE